MDYGTRNERISEAKKGKSNYKRRKPISQFSLSGEYIRDWDSITQAEQKLNLSHITACCKGKLNKCGGYIWRYKE